MQNIKFFLITFRRNVLNMSKLL